MPIVLPHFGPQALTRRTRGGYVGPFDGITFAALYGLKRFLTSYTGPLIRLRRDSDNAESDFGYVEATGLLDTAAVATWLGGANGYVVTWYDQSGNAKNATQSTTTAQPAYTASGINNLPALDFDGSDDAFTLPNSTYPTGNSSYTLIATIRTGSAIGQRGWMGSGVASTDQALNFRTDNASGTRLQTYWWDDDHIWSTTINTTTAYTLSSTFDAGVSRRMYKDGGTPNTSASLARNGSAVANYVGRSIGGGEVWDDYIVFAAIMASSVSAANHNTIGNELADIYGLTWTTVT